MNRGARRGRSSGLSLVVIMLAMAVSGCLDNVSNQGRPPVPLSTEQPRSDPFIYGEGEPLLVFATVGGNVLDVNRTSGPVVDFLGHRLGVRFRLEYYRRYPEIIEALAESNADFAWLGPTTYLAIRRKVACIPVAQILRQGVSYYEGVILVRGDDGATRVQDLKGKRFAFIDRQSTSGYLYPLAFLRRQGIEPASFFASVDFAGGHSDALLRLVNGQYDAVCTERDIIKRLAYKVETSRTRVLAVTGRIPNGPIAVHPRHSPEFIQRVRRILTTMSTDPEGAKLLADLASRSNLSGFGPIDEHAYDEVERVLADAEKVEP